MSAHRPRGIPVSRAILLPPGPLGDELRPVLAAIDRVHGDGALPQLLVLPEPELDAAAAYDVIPVTGEPFRVAANPSAIHLALSLVHEIGHFLLHAGIGPVQLHQSGDLPLFEAWRAAVRLSERFATLADLARLTSNEELSARLHYELRYTELWARSYAQYVAVRGNDERLLSQLQQRRIGFVSGMPIPIQWSFHDFAAIAKAIDDLFQSLGWMT